MAITHKPLLNSPPGNWYCGPICVFICIILFVTALRESGHIQAMQMNFALVSTLLFYFYFFLSAELSMQASTNASCHQALDLGAEFFQDNADNQQSLLLFLPLLGSLAFILLFFKAI